MSKPSEGKLLYHITHIDNMASILENGLLPRHMLTSGHACFKDIADQNIIDGREHYKRDLSNYVPFHFYAKNPFDGAVCKKYGSENMVIITIHRDLYKKNDFLIIPSHPLDRSDPDIFPYEEGFNLIKWDILDGDSRDYHDPEIKKACMAECDVRYRIRPDVFSFVYIHDTDELNTIMNLPGVESILPKLQVKPNMFPNF